MTVPSLIAASLAAVAVETVPVAAPREVVLGNETLQEAIDRLSASGGGRVVVPAGIRTIGTTWLRSRVEVHLEKGAVLLGSTKRTDYNPDDSFPENFAHPEEEWSGGHLLIARRVEDVAITGEGTIDGNGPAFFGAPEPVSRSPSYKYGLKLHTKDRTWFRPGPMIAMFGARNVRLEGVTLRHPPCWTTHFRCCDGIEIRGVTIDADRQIANSDGFSVDCSRNVSIRDCTIRTGDDGFAIRASCGLHAASTACERIRISNCDVWSCCYGVRFGVGTGEIRDVEISNCRFHESYGGFAFTPAWVDAPKNAFIENIRIHDCRSCESLMPVVIEMPKNGQARVRDVQFRRCSFEALMPSAAGDSPFSAPEDVVFDTCSYRMIERLAVGLDESWLKANRTRPQEFITLYGKAKSGVRTVDCRFLRLGGLSKSAGNGTIRPL